MKLYELEQKLNRQKNRIGLVGGRLKLKQASDAEDPISAHIEPRDWHIEIAVKKDHEPVRDEKTKSYCRHRAITQPLETMCRDILFHECGHWELPRGSKQGCPYDIPHHDRIIESVSQALQRHNKQGLEKYVANAFEDVLVNTNCKQHTDHTGLILFWNEQGMTKKTFNKFYDAFVRLNLALWGEGSDAAFLKRWRSEGKEATQALQSILAQWNLPKGSSTEQLHARVACLYQEERWLALAAQFAEAMAPLLDEPQKHTMFGAQGNGSGNQKGETGKDSAFDKKLASRKGKEEVAYGRYTAGCGPATNRDSYEQLDALYRRLARDIPVEIETFTQAYSFPLVPYGREQFDPDIHDLLTRKVHIGLQDDGTPGITVNKAWIRTNEVYKRNIRKFPRFRLALLDTSSSMKDAPDGSSATGSKAFVPWGDNSKYHYALLGYYGIEQFLQRQHIAPYVDAGTINFSATSKTATGEDARKNLLTPQWGGTTIDIDVLRQHAKNNTFLLSISDGDIWNWDSIREAYKAIVTQCASAHIQIGSENQFSKDLESWDIPVSYVQGGEDLAHLMVKITSNKYKSYARTRQ